MIYKLDEESKSRIEDLADLQEHVSAIHASVQAGEDGQEEIQISIREPLENPSGAPVAVHRSQLLQGAARDGDRFSRASLAFYLDSLLQIQTRKLDKF